MPWWRRAAVEPRLLQHADSPARHRAGHPSAWPMTCAWQRNSSLFLMILIATCSFLILRGASKADPQCPSTQPRTCATLFQRNGAKSQRHCEYSHRSQPEIRCTPSRLARTSMGCEMCSASGITLGHVTSEYTHLSYAFTTTPKEPLPIVRSISYLHCGFAPMRIIRPPAQ